MDDENMDAFLGDFLREVPQLDLSYIRRLSSATGILQHASFNIPNYHHGYCLDDNARALLLLVLAAETNVDSIDIQLFSTYLSFIYYAQNMDGNFKNFMAYNHDFLEDIGSDDSFGRTIWAIGTTLGSDSYAQFHPVCQDIFNKSLVHLRYLRSPRACAYALVGLCKFLEKHPQDMHVIEEIHTLTDFLQAEYNSCSSESWPWFEEIVSYDNAMLPLSMLMAGRLIQREDLMDIGWASFRFLDKILFKEGYLSTIGNQNWFVQGATISTFGQQPLEIPGIMMMYQEVNLQKSAASWKSKQKLSFLWYLGKNAKGLSLYNSQDKSCYDGLEEYGINQNQGAESNIAFWMAYALLSLKGL